MKFFDGLNHGGTPGLFRYCYTTVWGGGLGGDGEELSISIFPFFNDFLQKNLGKQGHKPT